MLGSSDAAVFAVLVLMYLALLLALRLRSTRRRRRGYAQRLAVATGHPSAVVAGARRAAAELATEVADQLTGMGLACQRADARVWAQGMAGEYVITVIRGGLHVLYRPTTHTEYRESGHEVYLGYFPTVDAGLREIARHAELRAPA